ncbi:hypothetical protein ABIC66_002381 [Caulobacter sp. 1776]
MRPLPRAATIAWPASLSPPPDRRCDRLYSRPEFRDRSRRPLTFDRAGPSNAQKRRVGSCGPSALRTHDRSARPSTRQQGQRERGEV